MRIFVIKTHRYQMSRLVVAMDSSEASEKIEAYFKEKNITDFISEIKMIMPDVEVIL